MAELHERITAELENIDTVVKEIEELIASGSTDKYAVNSFALYLHNFLHQTFHCPQLFLHSGTGSFFPAY